MSSTELDTLLDAVFEDTILPLHDQLKVRGIPLFPTAPDPSLNTYYHRRAQTRMSREDFCSAGYEDETGLASALERTWQDETGLRSGTPPHVELAQALGEIAQEQQNEVSPFLYAMF